MRYLLRVAVLALALVTVSSCFRTGPRKIDVIVAARDLATGTTIAATDIDIIQIDPSVAPKSVPRFRHEVIGHQALRPMTKGELILPFELSAEAKVQ